MRREATEAAQALTRACGFDVSALPALVVLTGPRAPRIEFQQPPGELLVLDWLTLIPSLVGLPPRLQPWRMRAVYAAARKSTTWPGGNLVAPKGESADDVALPGPHRRSFRVTGWTGSPASLQPRSQA